MTDSEGITNAKQKQNTLNCKEYPHIECDPGAELTRQTEELKPLLVMHLLSADTSQWTDPSPELCKMLKMLVTTGQAALQVIITVQNFYHQIIVPGIIQNDKYSFLYIKNNGNAILRYNT